jgi:hypothetical protein
VPACAFNLAGSGVSLEILDFTLVFFGRGARSKRPEIFAMTGLRAPFP